ncbi:conserved hypothetical protein [Ricinus communis]|uniref:Uncharacterized protein n=1 Tax=Ricinus communis TaxID=3988 RepID=B9TN68_RICCO|nr:conserved hypothetical protein [Ricinus communis]
MAVVELERLYIRRLGLAHQVLCLGAHGDIGAVDGESAQEKDIADVVLHGRTMIGIADFRQLQELQGRVLVAAAVGKPVSGRELGLVGLGIGGRRLAMRYRLVEGVNLVNAIHL